MDDLYGRGTAVVDELATESIGEETSDPGLTVETFSTFEDEEGIDHELRELSTAVENSLPVEGFHLGERLVKDNLEDLLLLLIGLHGETHGKELMTNVAQLTGTQLSPGTLYPVLHDLEADGILTMRKKVRTKAYSIDDHEHATEQLERSMIEHLSFGLLQHVVLSRFREQ